MSHVSKPCRTCGAPVASLQGLGRPREFCDVHAPARRAGIASWQRANAVHVRAYQRTKYGHRPLEDRVCACACRVPCCGETFLGYIAACPRCRQPAHRATWAPETERMTA